MILWLFGIENQNSATPEAELESARTSLAALSIVRPLQFVTILFALRQFVGVQFYQLGLSAHRPAKDFIAGYGFWLVLTPIVYGVHWLVLQSETAQTHPIEKLLASISNPYWLALICLAPVVLAPLTEELLFRGVIQPYLVRYPTSADGLMIGALASAVWYGVTKGGLWPTIFLVVGGGGYLLFEKLCRRWLPRPGAARAIYATSILFASIHAEIWPSPVPLFVLSLGLGFLSYRTQSIVGPIVVHSIFNAVSALALLIQRTAATGP